MKKNSVFIFTAGASLVLATLLLSAAKTPDAPTVQNFALATGKGAFGALQVPTQAVMARGQVVYQQVCLACHMADAGGVQGMNPPLIKTKYVLGLKAPLIKIVLNGMTGDLDINGDTYHNVMAPHSDLTDQQIADVLTYVRNSFGNKASAVSVAQVKAVRAANKPAGK
jgi:mono/diheme cytochrome c family protein